jgi:hypothetical protein
LQFFYISVPFVGSFWIPFLFYFFFFIKMPFFLQLRVVKAFHLVTEDTDERRSLASTQSLQSIRGGGGGHHSAVRRVDTNEEHPTYLITTGPQPYPLYHHKQRSPSPIVSSSTGNNALLNGNNHGNNSIGITTTSNEIEKVPIVQTWDPNSGTSSSVQANNTSNVSRLKTKSTSLDGPASIAHL